MKNINVSWEIFIAYYDVNTARIKCAFGSLSMINKVEVVFSVDIVIFTGLDYAIRARF